MSDARERRETEQSTLVDDEEDGETGVPRGPTALREHIREEKHPDWIEHDDEFDHVRPQSIYTPPLLTRQHGWRKWHADRDCGAQTVWYTERGLAGSTSTDEFAWRLGCGRCGTVKPREVLFLNESWYYSLMDEATDWPGYSAFGNLWLNDAFVLGAGGLPSDEDTREVIRRSFYESEAQQRMAPPMPWNTNG